MTLRRPSPVTVANEQVSIVTVCQLVGVDVPDDIGSGRSRKVHCPFGEVYHSDHGAAAAMRIYPDSNSAWCFSCSMYFTPVKLAAQAWDQDPQTAALRLLDRVGYRPVDLAQAWASVTSYEPEPNRALLADALKTYCRRIAPGWGQQQFEPRVAATLTRCLALLDLVKTDEDVKTWLESCKTAMKRVLAKPEPTLSQKYDLLLRSMNMTKGETA